MGWIFKNPFRRINEVKELCDAGKIKMDDAERLEEEIWKVDKAVREVELYLRHERCVNYNKSSAARRYPKVDIYNALSANGIELLDKYKSCYLKAVNVYENLSNSIVFPFGGGILDIEIGDKNYKLESSMRLSGGDVPVSMHLDVECLYEYFVNRKIRKDYEREIAFVEYYLDDSFKTE